jgi:hypothetical protein
MRFHPPQQIVHVHQYLLVHCRQKYFLGYHSYYIFAPPNFASSPDYNTFPLLVNKNSLRHLPVRQPRHMSPNQSRRNQNIDSTVKKILDKKWSIFKKVASLTHLTIHTPTIVTQRTGQS